MYEGQWQNTVNVASELHTSAALRCGVFIQTNRIKTKAMLTSKFYCRSRLVRCYFGEALLDQLLQI